MRTVVKITISEKCA